MCNIAITASGQNFYLVAGSVDQGCELRNEDFCDLAASCTQSRRWPSDLPRNIGLELLLHK